MLEPYRGNGEQQGDDERELRAPDGCHRRDQDEHVDAVHDQAAVIARRHEGHRGDECDEHDEQPEAALVEDARQRVARGTDTHWRLPWLIRYLPPGLLT